MNQRELFRNYFHEVEDWCESVLHILDSRAAEIYNVHILEYKIQLLLERLKYQGDCDVDFVYEVSDDVENIQHRLEEMLTYGRQEGLLTYERGYAYTRQAVPVGGHMLPPLPYPYDSLEPYISKQIMMLHHDKHHRSYVDGLNKAELMMQKARETNDYALLKHWEREAAFHGSGHYLHTIFWSNMRKGGSQPSGALLQQIEEDFGSFGQFKQHFSEAANKVEGSGWAILVWAPRAGRLEILQSTLHHLFTQWDTIPLLVLDVWEHAYYLQYQNRREEYVQNWWNVVNWANAAERFEKARQLEWQPF
ncbi:superoxide dismutase [Ectobacillus ponti]|uniref:superoxide dismutase n=1 Tax=Ectobacillus ponti TaxID=2961894 RepID=A0AA42BQQ8_9BACI|nr:superoxide dismutase [Ectobacillus ponti]MCP8968709.1 superoxide dismutase [Ectobacillus ponti]